MSAVARILTRLGDRLHRLGDDARGNIALGAALIGPTVILLGVGAADLFAVHSAQNRLQSIADAGALAGALALATDGAAAKERAAAFVTGAMSEWRQAPAVEGTYEIVDQGGQRAIRVLLRGHRSSFLANMLPPGGWTFSAGATAPSPGSGSVLRPRDWPRPDEGPAAQERPRDSAPA